ncbi:hypothetical protein BDD43_5947 [Mucilaginibacter gracilis]|uniref:Uncharacterized protein n=1 Tax=Mucilaginibacter gracilis TaxID=423350 RepID=A0A495J9H9_9SPHI|nr:hypothetical protein BDD43_5947 [Mucilaginibacter gracilis]
MNGNTGRKKYKEKKFSKLHLITVVASVTVYLISSYILMGSGDCV